MTFNVAKSKAYLQLSIILALSIGTCASSFAQETKLPSVVALFGDSTSLGVNDNYIALYGPEKRYWSGALNIGTPSLALSALLNNSRRLSLVSNMGYGGTRSGPSGPMTGTSGIERIGDDLDKVMKDHRGKHYYALIMYGTNDFKGDLIPPSTTGFNVKLMVEAAIRKNYTVLVSTILPCDVCGNNGSHIAPTNQSIRENVREAIKENPRADIHFVDTHLAVRRNWNNGLVDLDGIHPTDLGYKVIANNWFNEVLSSLIGQEEEEIEEERSSTVLPPIYDLLLDNDA